MSLNILDHVALAYQPIWGAQRQLVAVRNELLQKDEIINGINFIGHFI